MGNTLGVILAKWIGKTFPNSLVTQFFPPPPRFSVNDIPDLEGKVILVTGGNQGIGYETVKACLAHNSKVYMASRSASKASQAIADLKQQTGKEAIFLQLDLSDLKSVKSAAEEFLTKEPALDVLFLNAGVLGPPRSALTAQGYDLQFGTNVIGHAYLSKLLLPALRQPFKLTGDKARVVSTSSNGHIGLAPLKGVVFDAILPGKARDKFGISTLYGMSKLGNIMWAQWLHRHYGEEIVASSVHPGIITSYMTKEAPLLVKLELSIVPYFPATTGALTQLYAGLSEETADSGGKYFVPWAREATPGISSKALVHETQEKLATFVEIATKDV